MSPRDYVEVDMSEQVELNSLEDGQPFIILKFLCVKLGDQYNYFNDDIIPEHHAACFCFNANDIMFVNLLDRVQPVRKIKIEIEKV